MDLSTLAVDIEAPHKLVLRHPETNVELEHNEKPIFLLVRSVDHPEVKKVERRISKKRIESVQQSRGKVKISADEIEEEATMRLVAHLAGWENLVMDGKPLVYSAEACKKLLNNDAFGWIRTQLDEFAGDRGNFLKTE